MNHAKTMIHCPACQTSLAVDASYEGQRGKCPKCKEQFVIRASKDSQENSLRASGQTSVDRTASDTSVQSASSKSTAISKTDSGRDGTSKSRSSEASIGKIGRFQLREVLGQGAFGRVYRAYDPQLDRLLALKVPIFHEDERKKAARFEEEAKAAANLRHPNIVPVFDSGKVDGHYYIAAQFIDGVPLSVHLKKGPLSFKQAAIWARQIASALAYAHEMGIVHRDVKPHNIILDSRNEPQLMDFGLAKRVNEDSTMTTEGALLGTPAYMSPEQARGDVANVGPQSDQYAVGAVLFEMLTGKRVYDGPPHAVLAQILSDVCPSPQAVRPDIPRDLCAITLKAMNKLPTQRYASCKELALDLDRWLQGDSVIARAPSFMERSLRIAQRNKTLTILSLGLMSVITVSLVAVSWALIQVERSRGRAEQNLATAQTQTQVANQQRDLAESEKRRAELAESNLRKKQESLHRSVYASRITQIQDDLKKKRDAFRSSQKLDAIAADPELKKLRGFEWHFWRNHLDQVLHELPINGKPFDFPLPKRYESCFISDDGEWALVCNTERAFVWKTASKELYQVTEFDRLKLPENEKLPSFFISNVRGVPKLLLNFKSNANVETAVVIDVINNVIESSRRDAAFVRIPGVGLALKQTDYTGLIYRTFPDGTSLGNALKFNSTLVGFDAKANHGLILTPEALEWRAFSDGTVLSTCSIDTIGKGRKVLDVSLSFPLQQILVTTALPQAIDSRQGVVLDIHKLQLIGAQKLDTQGGMIHTALAESQPKVLIALNDSLHVVEDARWFELDAKSAFEKSVLSIAIESRSIAVSPDFNQAITIVGSKTRQSYDALPVLCSLQSKKQKFQYKREDDFFRNRFDNGPPYFSFSKLTGDTLNVRLVQAHTDGSTEETVKSIKFPFRKSPDTTRRPYQILFRTREVCALSQDGKSIHFFSLDGASDKPTKTISLNEEADFLVLDPTESRVAVTHAIRSKEARKGSLSKITGKISIVHLDKADTNEIIYDFYEQCAPEFDVSGLWLFLHNGQLRYGYKDGVQHTQQFEDDLKMWHRTKIYDSITGEEVVDVPFPEGQLNRTKGDAVKGVFARGTYIYGRDGAMLCEVEDRTAVLGMSSDGSRFLTANSVVDATNGEVLLELDLEQATQFWIQGDYGYCVLSPGFVTWYAFSTRETESGTETSGSQRSAGAPARSEH